MPKFLTSDFLSELLKYCFTNKTILELVRDHLKFQYIPTELPEIKKILKSITTYYNNNEELPTYGIVSQQHATDLKVQEYLEKIKQSQITNIDSLLIELEDYIKKIRFQLLHKKTFDLYNEDKGDEAIELAAKESEAIVQFSLKREARRFVQVFGDFEEDVLNKQKKRESGEFDTDRVPTGIREIDEEIYGGIDVGDTMCFLGRSGSGKSTILKYIGVYAARLGYDVLHIQLEGSKQECFDKYTQVWSAMKYNDTKYANIGSDLMKKLKSVVKTMQNMKRDVHIFAFEMFDEASCKDVRDLIIEFIKMRGKEPDLVILDSIDLIHPGDGLKYGISTEAIKKKKENSANKIKNIATEFKTRVITVDQADNIQKEFWNDPTWVMTRSNVSGAKNLPNSFSYFITLNQTEKEQKDAILRLYFDKLRNYFPKNRIVTVATNFKHGRFYDRERTLRIRNGEEKIESNIKVKTTSSKLNKNG